MKDRRIYYLNPPYPDLSLEQELLAGTGFELIPVSVQGELIDQIADAVAIMTHEVPITESVAAQLPNCKVVTRMGVGFDIIDVPGCRKYGIEVCYVPDYGTEDVANHAIALLFAVHRHLLQYHRSVEQGRWDFNVAGKIHLLKELRLGIFGLGRIGSDFAGKMRVFVKEILGYDPNLSNAAIVKKGARPSSPEEIFSECEIISLHLPYSPKSHHFVSNREIDLMTKKPILINVSRGGLVDTQALIRGLRTNRLSGAGLDVLETEPKVEQELLQLENVIVTPHVAWFSVEASRKLRRTAMTDILRVLSRQAPLYPVPG
ncbi:MAG TPA: C-terminal binding protein [Chthoniobacterales bacterium]|jgi:D-3-phosphoglycerate dehydrogenase